MLMLITKTKILTDEFQKTESSIIDGKITAPSTIKFLNKIRDDEKEVHREINVAIKICSKIDIDALKVYEDRHVQRFQIPDMCED